MNYIKVVFTLTPYTDFATDLLIAELGKHSYDSFINIKNGVEAFIQEESFDEECVKNIIANFFLPDYVIHYATSLMKKQNWNEKWENEGFKPININDECYIHSPEQVTLKDFTYDITIYPHQSFGTGGHATTSMILETLMKLDLCDSSVLDMGCGTAVLAIMAAKRGATDILAVDIDEWCVESSKENIKLNATNFIRLKKGDASVLTSEKQFNLILANIHKNILLQDMATYVEHLSDNGRLIISGFYQEDILDLVTEAQCLGLSLELHKSHDEWQMLTFY